MGEVWTCQVHLFMFEQQHNWEYLRKPEEYYEALVERFQAKKFQ